MKNRTYLLPVLLTAVVTAACLVALVIESFFPGRVLPKLDIPAMVALSLVALTIHYYLGNDKICYVSAAIFGVGALALLPLLAGLATPALWWKYAIAGGITFPTTTYLFRSLTQRLRSAPMQKLAPIVGAIGLFLAAQILSGMFL